MKRTSLPLLAACCALTANAQSTTPEVLGSAGGHGANSSASVTWTVGEAVTETAGGTAAQLTQGFNQPRFNFALVTVENDEDEGITVYPNPSADRIVVEAHDAPQGRMAIFFDMDGRRVLGSRLTDQRTTIDLSSLAPANYLLDLQDQDGRSRARFTINKIK